MTPICVPEPDALGLLLALVVWLLLARGAWWVVCQVIGACRGDCGADLMGLGQMGYRWRRLWGGDE